MVLRRIVWKYSLWLSKICVDKGSIKPLKVHNEGQGKHITAKNQILKMKLIVVPVPAYFLGSKQQMKPAGVYI